MKTFLKRLWDESRVLTGAGAVLLGAFVLSLVGVEVDRREVLGAPAWMKPAKFAISTAIFCWSMAWLFRYIDVAPKMKRVCGPLLAYIGVLEVAIIDFQAARGTASHFNVSTPENAILFSIMGTAIGVLWLGTVWVLMALFRQRFNDAGWGWALRMGMLLTVLGSAAGGMMLRSTPTSVAGAHTVGAPDGGPGLPATNWSREHGDMRIPHFLGLHGLQAIPLALWWMRRRRVGVNETRAVFAVAASYGALMALLMWQALRGESIAAPGAETVVAMAIWLAGSVAGMVAARNRLTRRVVVA